MILVIITAAIAGSIGMMIGLRCGFNNGVSWTISRVLAGRH